MIERDRRDERREIAPLAPAGDAVILDTTFLTEVDVYNKALTIIGFKKRL